MTKRFLLSRCPSYKTHDKFYAFYQFRMKGMWCWKADISRHIPGYACWLLKLELLLLLLLLLLLILLTQWSRVLLEKLTVLQLVKKFPSFYLSRRFITAFIIIIIIITFRDYSKIVSASWPYYPSCPIKYDFRNRNSGWTTERTIPTTLTVTPSYFASTCILQSSERISIEFGHSWIFCPLISIVINRMGTFFFQTGHDVLFLTLT
jgi:hypothetical protein